MENEYILVKVKLFWNDGNFRMVKSKKKTEKAEFTKKIESVATKELEDCLLSKKIKDINKLLKEKNDVEIYEITNKNCSDYMKDLIKQKGFTQRKVISLAGMSESYGRQVLSGKKGISKRDTIIRICIASNFSVVETNRALKLYNMPVLYVKNKRDALILIAINEGDKLVESVNKLLVDNDLEPLKQCSNDKEDDES